MADERPNFNKAVRALLRDVALAMPEFTHVRPTRVLVVAGEARRASRGTVKPLAFRGGKATDSHGRRKPVVKVRGKRMLYCVTLRPLFFLDSTPEERVETLLHELFHVSRRFDGTLHAGRRHAVLGPAFEKRFRPLVERYLARCPAAILAPFAQDGEVRVLQWRERPPAALAPGRARGRRVYTEAQLFYGPVRMATGARARKRLLRGLE